MKVGVVIGRFQPLHIGHAHLLNTARNNCDKLIVLIGSANRARSIKNPWTYKERVEQITFRVEKDQIEPIDGISPLNDYLYSDEQWINDVRAAIQMHVSKYDNVSSITIFGHEKAGNDYLSWFPEYKFYSVDSPHEISATQVRRKMYENFSDYLPMSVYNDFKYFDAEKERFKVYPYPETLNFNCSDALVVCSGHVLLIKRKFAPGENTWALPGGFKNRNETFQECALRELIEETNIRVPEKVLRGSIVGSRLFDNPDRGNGIPRNTLVVHYHIEPNPDGKLPRANGNDDASETKWVSLFDAVNNYRLFDDHSDIIQVMTGVKSQPAIFNATIN